MYRVLLVDDEKIIREGIYELLSMTDLDLDLTMAASAVEAISVLEERKIDIILMDICMPQMSGLELYDVILQRWPRIKMIFLTGYLEFDYVYKVHKHARYVLKAEEDEKIVEAVKESIEEIENDLLLEQMTRNHSRHQHRSKYYERLLLLRELVEGSISSSLVTQEMIRQTGSDLDISEKLYCILIRCGVMRRKSHVEQAAIGEKMNALIENIFLENWRGTYFGYNKNLTYVLVQPKEAKTNIPVLLEGDSETFQKAVMKNLNLPISVFISEEPVDFHHAVNDFAAIRDRMVSMTEDEIQTGCIHEQPGQAVSVLPANIRRELNLRCQQLDNQFDGIERENVLISIRYMKEQVKVVDSNRDLFVLELYFSVIAKVLSYAKKVGLSEDSTFHTGVLNLYNISEYHDWESAFENIYRVVRHVFEHVDISIENKNEDVINRVKTYIDDHLDGDTSLYILSSHVHLCPEHLLRLFKKQEGVTILQYINDLKLEKAKQMLADTDIQIKDIATRLGFTSAGYFGRFFKSKLGVTPNVYRDQKRK